MLNRRAALAGISATAAYAMSAHAADAPAAQHWSGYRQSLVIDGAGGPMLGFLPDGDPQIPNELAAIRASGLTSCVLTVGPSGRFWLDDEAHQRTRDNIAHWDALIARYSDYMLPVRTSADLARARSENKLGIIYTFQGTEPLGEDEDRIATYRESGVRVIQLTHNRRNLVGDGSLEGGNAGLSNFGRRVVAKLEEEKVVVDLAHGAARTISEGIAACTKPMLISHTGCRALANHPRNVSDASLRAMAQKGGVAGIIFWPYIREDTQPMAVDVIRHIEHAINVCGEDHVGLGTDGGVAATERTPEFERENREWVADAVEDGIFQHGRPPDLYTFIPDLNTPDRFDTLAAKLSARGHSDARIGKILGGNFARVMREVWG